jgi:hypothetical protein
MSLPPAHALTAELGGLPTRICCQLYSDYIFLVVSQLPTFGTLVESRATRNLDGKETVSIRTLLGERDNDIVALCARVVLECVRADAAFAGGGEASPEGAAAGGGGGGGAARLPILLGLGLRPENCTFEVVRELKSILESNRPWAKAS